MSAEQVNSGAFWERKSLHEMSAEEWESLCDGCGRCCVQKLEDEDSGEIFYTAIACRYLDSDACRCTVYETRNQRVPDCLRITPDAAEIFPWLPESCAYRLIHAGKPLPDWHHLISGSRQTVHEVDISVRDKVVSEDEVPEEEWEEHIITWVD